MQLRPPGETPCLHRLTVDGQGLALWEWEGTGDPILLVHATGFHGRCWDAVVRRLPGRKVLALDQASHGASDPKPPPYEAALFGQDIVALARQLGLRRVVGVGHSMGGHAMVVAAAREPEVFAGLLLFDPVIVGPGSGEESALSALRAEEHPVGRRRNHWPDAGTMIGAFSRRDPYRRWDPEVLRDYCRFGLRETDGGAFELACPPRLEVEVYVGMHMRTVFEDIPRVRVPVDVVRGRDRRPQDSPMDFSPSPTWPRLASLFADGRDEQLCENTHFFPMELPGWTAARIARFVDTPRD